MTHTINKSTAVKGLLAHQFAQICTHLFFICHIIYMLFKILHHLHHFDIGTTDEKTGEEKTETVNCRGVYVLDGEKVEFRRLDVIYEGKDYVLSSLNAGDGYLIQYDSIIVEGIDADGN